MIMPKSFAGRYLFSNFSMSSFLTGNRGLIAPHLFSLPKRLIASDRPSSPSAYSPIKCSSFIIVNTVFNAFEIGLIVHVFFPIFSALCIFDNAAANGSFIAMLVVFFEADDVCNIAEALPTIIQTVLLDMRTNSSASAAPFFCSAT